MPTDDDTGWIEPDIIVNGHVLTFAECMSVRVAITSFRMQLSDPQMRRGLGEDLSKNYDHHLLNVERAMLIRPVRHERDR